MNTRPTTQQPPTLTTSAPQGRSVIVRRRIPQELLVAAMLADVDAAQRISDARRHANTGLRR